jgi:restriction system protein
MSGPKFVQFFSPVIEALKELGGSGRPSEVREVISRQLNISESDRTELLDGGAPRFDNQVAWARFYLVKESLVDSSNRGVWSLSDRGREIESLSFDESLAIFRRIHSEFQPEKVSEEEIAQQDEIVEETIAPNDTAVSDDSSYLDILLCLKARGFLLLVLRSPLAMSDYSSIVEAIFSPVFRPLQARSLVPLGTVYAKCKHAAKCFSPCPKLCSR